jgi:hypothetical protein
VKHRVAERLELGSDLCQSRLEIGRSEIPELVN